MLITLLFNIQIVISLVGAMVSQVRKVLLYTCMKYRYVDYNYLFIIIQI